MQRYILACIEEDINLFTRKLRLFPMVERFSLTLRENILFKVLKDFEREPLRYWKGDKNGDLYKTFPDVGQGDL